MRILVPFKWRCIKCRVHHASFLHDEFSMLINVNQNCNSFKDWALIATTLHQCSTNPTYTSCPLVCSNNPLTKRIQKAVSGLPSPLNYCSGSVVSTSKLPCFTWQCWEHLKTSKQPCETSPGCCKNCSWSTVRTVWCRHLWCQPGLHWPRDLFLQWGSTWWRCTLVTSTILLKNSQRSPVSQCTPPCPHLKAAVWPGHQLKTGVLNSRLAVHGGIGLPQIQWFVQCS